MRRELALIWSLYAVQGLPFGFQTTAIPVLLYERGASLEAVGLSTALATPWLLKPLWSPLVDRYHSSRLGRRKSWLLPMQALLALTMLVAATSHESLPALLASVLAMNLFAATLDIAVDGFAVDHLGPGELGHGNTAQVVGYKIGMLIGGGLLLWGSERIGLVGMFVAMAMLVAAVALATLLYQEPPRAHLETGTTESLREILGALQRALSTSGAGWLLAVVATYKIGESMADVMFKPFVLSLGYTKADVGRWLGTWGMLFSLAGSVLGGYLATRLSFVRAVTVAGVLRLGPLLAQWWLALTPHPPEAAIVAITCAEHLAGGALTTAMFALMMSRVDRRVGASHFTILAAIEVLGKTPAGWLSGFVAARTGFAWLFGFATIASAAFLLLLWPLARTSPRTEAA
ncbi:MAG: MFS transporter [Polyangiaceae bacterium]